MSITSLANIKQNIVLAATVIVAMLTIMVGPIVGSVHAQTVPQDTIAITQTTLGCGAANLTFSGTAGFVSGLPHRIIVKLDGVQIYTDDSKPTSWTTPAVAVSEGAHTLTAEVWDLDENNNLDTIDDDDSWDFTIPPCPTPTPAVGGGPGDEQDCCPGHDPEPASTPTGTVLGTTTKKATPTPTPQVAAATTFKAPATGMSALPSLALALISSSVAAGLQRKRG